MLMQKNPGHYAFHNMLFIIVSAFLLFAGGASAQEPKVGTVDFPTSTRSAEVQRHFIRGVAELHSFWFDEAADEFRAAEKMDPNFMMAYWGEAMTYNHPLWAQQDTEAGRRIVAGIHDTPNLTPRERAYIAAVKALYGQGDKLQRDWAYCRVMEKLYRDFPDDESALFYALSLLGTVRPGDLGYRRQMKAGAIALAIFQKDPDHPGAAHYIIHSFDDPEHAILALPAAREYAKIAPASSHAQHMPSHIFVQLGMWDDDAASNERAWAVSCDWVKERNLPISKRDYHSFIWLDYAYLQQGRYQKAAEVIDQMNGMVKELNDPAMAMSLRRMRAAFIAETGRWELADKWFARETSAESKPTAGGEHSGHSGMGGPYGGGTPLPVYIAGLAAAERGLPAARKSVEELDHLAESMSKIEPYAANSIQIMSLEIQASLAASNKNYDLAIASMKKAAAIEDQMSPPSGPPEIVKPPLELYGEILLAAGKPKDAAEQFDASLIREPNRARSLIGRARALAAAGQNVEAADAYSEFARIWHSADTDLPELKEARSHSAAEAAAGR